jgi:uncharacterized protein (TIGR02118 family)
MWQFKAGIVAASLIVSSAALSAELKLTVLYSHPRNVEEFDKYYYGKHMPMVYALKEIKKVEIARPRPGPNDAPPPYYLITELWFENPEVFTSVEAGPSWKAIGADVANFAPPGMATIIISDVDPER